MSQPNSSLSITGTALSEHDVDVEVQRKDQKRASNWQLVIDQTHVTPEVLNYLYKGSGTEEDPYVVEYIPNDRRDPMLFPRWRKWAITLLVAFVSSLACASIAAQ